MYEVYEHFDPGEQSMRNIINHQIDECLLSYENEKDSKKTQGILLPQTLRCRRGVDKDIDTIHQFSSSVAAAAGVDEDYSDSERTSAADHPLHFYILLEEIKLEEKDGKDKDHGHDTKSQSILKGVAMWYFGYSTWQGKVMNVDTLLISRDGSINEKILLDALVTIAKSFSLRRIVYQVKYHSQTNFQQYAFIVHLFFCLHVPRTSFTLCFRALRFKEQKKLNYSRRSMVQIYWANG